MSISLVEKIRANIFSSDDFVISVVRKIQYIYKPKTEIRYNQQRLNPLRTESVAEHTFGIHILADYFTPLEEVGSRLD